MSSVVSPLTPRHTVKHALRLCLCPVSHCQLCSCKTFLDKFLKFELLELTLHAIHNVWSGPVLTGLRPLDWSRAAKTKDQTAGPVFGTLETAGPDRHRTRPKTGLGTGPGPDRRNSSGDAFLSDRVIHTFHQRWVRSHNYRVHDFKVSRAELLTGERTLN
jgi:hypothetical protein